MSRAADRIAIVTGASRRAGIGAAIAETLVAAGWSVLITGHPPYDQAQGLAADADGLAAVAERIGRVAQTKAAGIPPRVELLAADLTDASAPERIVATCHDRLGAPTALVNNAAVSERGGLVDASAEQLDRHWAVNARAAVLLTAAYAKRFRAETGAVVNVTSGQGLGAMPGELAYAVSKGALESFTTQAAAELAPLGIRVNAVDPGPTDTGWMTDRDRSALVAPLGRVGLPADAARIVAWLCSNDARWITGQVVRSRGGA